MIENSFDCKSFEFHRLNAYWRRLLDEIPMTVNVRRRGFICRRLLFLEIDDGLPFHLKLKMSKLEFLGATERHVKASVCMLCVAFNKIACFSSISGGFEM